MPPTTLNLPEGAPRHSSATRWLRALRWLTAVLAVGLVSVWGSSLRLSVQRTHVATDSRARRAAVALSGSFVYEGGYVELVAGAIHWDSWAGGSPIFSRFHDDRVSWSIERNVEPLHWRVWFSRSPFAERGVLPLWLPTFAAAVPSTALWYVAIRRNRRARARMCELCGYSRIGLNPAERCPECGQTP